MWVFDRQLLVTVERGGIVLLSYRRNEQFISHALCKILPHELGSFIEIFTPRLSS